jgi:putative thioredoxin
VQLAAQPGGSAAAGGVVIKVTAQTFYSDVVQRSHATPVILYLWADWFWPCRHLGPLLEKLAEESGGQWVLATVDIDANPQLKAALAAGAATVAAVADGQLVDRFLGQLEGRFLGQLEAQLRQWLSQVPAAAEKKGLKVTISVDPYSPEQRRQARAREREQQALAMEQEREDRIVALLRKVNPPDPDSWR